MNKPLLGIIISVMLMTVGLVTGSMLSDEAFSIETSEEIVQPYPEGNQNWTDFGSLNGTINTEGGDLVLTGSSGEFISDKFISNETIVLDQVIAETNNIQGSGDIVNVYMNFLDDEGTIVDSQNVSVEQDIETYAFNRQEVSGYQFIIEMEQDEQGQDVEFKQLTVTYDRITLVTDDLPFNLSEFLTIVPFILGLIIGVMSFTTTILRL